MPVVVQRLFLPATPHGCPHHEGELDLEALGLTCADRRGMLVRQTSASRILERDVVSSLVLSPSMRTSDDSPIRVWCIIHLANGKESRPRCMTPQPRLNIH